MNTLTQFVAFDLETTGLDFDHDSIIEIAMIKFIDGKLGESYTKTISPQVEVRDFILKLTGLDQKEIESSSPFSYHATEIEDFIGDLPLVAHNSRFDIHFLNKELRKAGRPGLDNPVIDSLLCSRIAWPMAPNHKLETLVHFLELDVTTAHRALPDAIHCGEVFIRAQGTFASQPIEVQEAMAAMSEGTSLDSLFEGSSARNKFDFKPHTNQLKTRPSPIEPSKQITLEDLFGSEDKEGVFHQEFDHYKFRRSQFQYAQSALKGLENDQFLSLEAETGIGKTLGYLAALAVWSQTNDARVVLSTGTRQQQNQIIDKTLPIIHKYFPLKATVVKGRDNYLCLRKYSFYLNHRKDTLSQEDREHFLTLIPWLAITQTGEISENSGFNPLRNRILWQKLKGDGRTCQGPSCQEEFKCFSFKARERAVKSQLLIINHALFFKDLEFDFALLPSWDRIIFDEAHQLIKQGPHHLGQHLMFYTLRNHFQLIHNPYAQSTGLIHALLKAPEALPAEFKLAEEILQQMESLEKKFHRFLGKIGKKISKQKVPSDRYAYTENFNTLLNLSPEPIYSALSVLIESCTQLTDLLNADNHQAAEFAQGLLSFRLELDSFQSQLRHIVEADQEGQVYWVQDWHNPHKLQLHSAPGHLSQIFNDKLFPWLRSALFTSATLTPNGQFDFFKNQIGLRKTSRTQEFRFESPFSQNQMTVKLMQGMSKGGSKGHHQETAAWLKEYLAQENHSTLVLYTSVAQLMNHQKTLKDHTQGRLLLSQHIDGTIDNLLGIFKKEKGSILLGNQVFWEGVDCPGDELETIIIPKLPFPNPFEPRLAWMSQQIEANGGNPFQELHVPLALLELKQGMGRLIRTEQDQGTLIILDNRVVKAPYGKQFHKLWNSQHEIISP